MPYTQMKIGDVGFGIHSRPLESFSRKVEYTWPSQERIGRRPAKQYTGMGEETMTLTGIVFTLFETAYGVVVGTKGPDQVAKLAGTGEPQMLVSGTGRVYGLFCIDSVSVDSTVLLDNGEPRQQTYTIELSHYGEDGNTDGVISQGTR